MMKPPSESDSDDDSKYSSDSFEASSSSSEASSTNSTESDSSSHSVAGGVTPSKQDAKYESKSTSAASSRKASSVAMGNATPSPAPIATTEKSAEVATDELANLPIEDKAAPQGPSQQSTNSQPGSVPPQQVDDPTLDHLTQKESADQDPVQIRGVQDPPAPEVAESSLSSRRSSSHNRAGSWKGTAEALEVVASGCEPLTSSNNIGAGNVEDVAEIKPSTESSRRSSKSDDLAPSTERPADHAEPKPKSAHSRSSSRSSRARSNSSEPANTSEVRTDDVSRPEETKLKTPPRSLSQASASSGARDQRSPPSEETRDHVSRSLPAHNSAPAHQEMESKSPSRSSSQSSASSRSAEKTSSREEACEAPSNAQRVQSREPTPDNKAPSRSQSQSSASSRSSVPSSKSSIAERRDSRRSLRSNSEAESGKKSKIDSRRPSVAASSVSAASTTKRTILPPVQRHLSLEDNKGGNNPTKAETNEEKIERLERMIAESRKVPRFPRKLKAPDAPRVGTIHSITATTATVNIVNPDPKGVRLYISSDEGESFHLVSCTDATAIAVVNLQPNKPYRVLAMPVDPQFQSQRKAIIHFATSPSQTVKEEPKQRPGTKQSPLSQSYSHTAAKSQDKAVAARGRSNTPLSRIYTPGVVRGQRNPHDRKTY